MQSHLCSATAPSLHTGRRHVLVLLYNMHTKRKDAFVFFSPLKALKCVCVGFFNQGTNFLPVQSAFDLHCMFRRDSPCKVKYLITKRG